MRGKIVQLCKEFKIFFFFLEDAFMKNMKIRMKLLVSLAVIIVATLVLGITAFVSTGHINNQVNILRRFAV